MAGDDVWILGINMTRFGKHKHKDVLDPRARPRSPRWRTAASPAK
jgi:hypothetical protein